MSSGGSRPNALAAATLRCTLGRRCLHIEAERDQELDTFPRYWPRGISVTKSVTQPLRPSLPPPTAVKPAQTAEDFQVAGDTVAVPGTPPPSSLNNRPAPTLALSKPCETRGKRVREKTPRRREQCRVNQARYRAKLKRLKLEAAIMAVGGSVDELPPVPAVPRRIPGIKKPRVRAKTPRRREQCRVNQARYRNKQRSHEQKLEASVGRLKTAIQQLETKRKRLLSELTPSQGRIAAAERVVQEFFRLFPDNTPNPLGISERARLHVLETHLHTYKRVFHALELSTTHIRPLTCGGPVAIVQAETILHGYITDQLIQDLFPHLLREPHRQLGDNLRGRRLELPCSWRFHCVDSRIVSIEAHLDLVAGLVCVFGRLEDVDVALQDSCVKMTLSLYADFTAPGARGHPAAAGDQGGC